MREKREGEKERRREGEKERRREREKKCKLMKIPKTL